MPFDINYKSPWLWGGAGLLLVLLLAGRSNSGVSSSEAAGLTSQATATSANVQLAGLTTALQSEQDQTAASLALGMHQIDSQNLALGLNYLTNQGNNATALAQTSAAVSVNENNNTTLLKLTSANNSTFAAIAPTLAQISASNSQALASIQAGEAEAIATTNANAMLGGIDRQNQGNLNTGLINNASGIGSAVSGVLGSIGSLFGL